MSLILLTALLVSSQAAPSRIVRLSILPSDTDASIRTFDSPHSVFIDPSAKSRGQLFLFLPGTNGKTKNADAFLTTAAQAGYQVISLMYPDDISAAVVHKDVDRNAFLNFRLEVIEGRDLSTYIAVGRSESIENRLVKVLAYLDKSRPTEHWKRFLDADGSPNWRLIAVSGLSQGAGHAALIAARHRVARAVLFGGPKDFDQATNSPAAWYTPSATPIESIFTFNHEQDRQGCTFKQQLEICRVMGLEKLGKPVSVDTSKPPFENSRILTTNYPGTSIPSIKAHTSVVADPSSPKGADGTRLFKPVWLYMLTSGQP
jgi:hypothetical protein